MTDSVWLRAIEAGDTLRLEWDNRRAPRDPLRAGISALVASACVPVALVLGCVAVGALGPEPWYMRVLAAVGAGLVLVLAVGVGRRLLARERTEWLEVSPAAITCGDRGQPTTYRLRPGAVWSFGRHGDESLDTVRLSWESSALTTSRVEFAEWLAAPARERVFLAVARFVEGHQIPLVVRRYD